MNGHRNNESNVLFVNYFLNHFAQTKITLFSFLIRKKEVHHLYQEFVESSQRMGSPM